MRAALIVLGAGRGPRDLHVDDAGLVDQALDRVRGAVLGQLHGAALGVERVPVLAELGVFEHRRGPQVGLGGVAGEDLGGKLAGDVDAAARGRVGSAKRAPQSILQYLILRDSVHNVTIDDLGNSKVTVLGHEVKGLGLHGRRVHALPF